MAISLIWLLQMRQLGPLLCGNAGLSNQRRSSLLKQGRATLWCSRTCSKGASSWRPLSRLRGTTAITRNSAWRTFSAFSQEEQHENELITALRGQVDLQHQLLVAQEGRIYQNDVKVAELAARVGVMGGHGASVSQMVAMGPPAVATPPLILGGAQPPGYTFVGQNLGLAIWGHPDIMQASISAITKEGDDK